MTRIINVERADLLNDGIYILAVFYKALLPDGVLGHTLFFFFFFRLLVGICIHKVQRAAFTFVWAQGGWVMLPPEGQSSLLGV